MTLRQRVDYVDSTLRPWQQQHPAIVWTLALASTYQSLATPAPTPLNRSCLEQVCQAPKVETNTMSCTGATKENRHDAVSLACRSQHNAKETALKSYGRVVEGLLPTESKCHDTKESSYSKIRPPFPYIT